MTRRRNALALVALSFLVLSLCPRPGDSLAQSQAQAVALELVLAVDCSSSVDQREFALQMTGIADAFEDPAVLAALDSAAPGGIAVSLLQWSGAGDQVFAVPERRVASHGEAARFAAEVRSSGRLVPGGATSISQALRVSREWLLNNDFVGERRVIDVSGDGRNNVGGGVEHQRALTLQAGISINGLAILQDKFDLSLYYGRRVIGGQGAFMLSATTFDDFAEAIRRKLILEITGLQVAAAPAATVP